MTALAARIGVIGCGDISGIYLEAGRTFGNLDIIACADLDMARARARADEYGVPRACTVDDLLADARVEIVLNLTPPAAHAEIGLAALRTGKHLYSEKPLASRRRDAQRMLDVARDAGLRVGCAPDTFLGGGLQTCRKLIDDGWIGEPIAATAFFLDPGPESWHPNPAFLYGRGAGPLFDMGPYYLTALIALLGPIRRVTGSARITHPRRLITSEPRRGTFVEVAAPTHVAGVLDFKGGAVGTMITSFDVWAGKLPHLDIYGTEGTLSLPDPNTFGGPVRARRAGAEGWSELPLTHGYTANSRGLGLAEMVSAIRSNRPHRASGELAYHVLDVMESLVDASREEAHVKLVSTCERPAPLPMATAEQAMDL